MPDLLFAPTPHDEAIAFIQGKPALTRDVYDQLLPELKPLAFTAAGIQSADALQQVRDLVAALPSGQSWDVAKRNVAAAISPYVVDPTASAEDQAKQLYGAQAKAELLLRLHGGQAYSAASHQVMERQKKAFPYWQYLTMADGRVRPSHRVLDGVVLPADHPFWQDHTPPWEWGCRCLLVPLSRSDRDDIEQEDAGKAPDNRRILDDATQQRLMTDRKLVRNGQDIDVRTPTERGAPNPYTWNPANVRPDLAQLKARYDATTWGEFERFAKATEYEPGKTVWSWLNAIAAPPPAPPAPVALPPAPAAPTLPVVPFTDETTWRTGKAEPGTLGGVDFASVAEGRWRGVQDAPINEPPARDEKGKPLRVARAGVLIREADGRVWIVEPTNHFGQRDRTLPGGGIEPALKMTVQQNALKEVWEETGLQVKITGFLGDFRDSNNGNIGRLYVGERIGGAPWNAKIEPKITDYKTGKPAAESVTVSLVTLDRAAALLHRTDDLAQLAAVRPIPVETPVKGKGSEALKKLVEGMQSAAREWERKEFAAGRNPGNPELYAAQELRGFNGKPAVVSKKDFDAMMAQSTHVEMLRGVQTHGSLTAKTMRDQFRGGDHFPGYGIFGSGGYADSTRGRGNVAHQYAGHTEPVMRIALPKNARIIKESELEKKVPSSPALFKGYAARGGKMAYECWMGVQAALAGYDAIYVDGRSQRHGSYGKDFYVILNRSILTVQAVDMPNSYRIP